MTTTQSRQMADRIRQVWALVLLMSWPLALQAQYELSVLQYPSQGNCDGILEVAATMNAQGPFTYLWGDGPTDMQRDSLCLGSYAVTVTDGNGCTWELQVDLGACDSIVCYMDADGDGYGTELQMLLTCDCPTGYVDEGGDCDDSDAAINPGQLELCDGIDNNCDGRVDEGLPGTEYYADLDGDGYGDPATRIRSCIPLPGYVTNPDDCNDGDTTIHPGVLDLCDLIDNDCDGFVDEDAAMVNTYYRDADGDGYGDDSDTLVACSLPSGYVSQGGDCDDANAAVHPNACTPDITFSDLSAACNAPGDGPATVTQSMSCGGFTWVVEYLDAGSWSVVFGPTNVDVTTVNLTELGAYRIVALNAGANCQDVVTDIDTLSCLPCVDDPAITLLCDTSTYRLRHDSMKVKENNNSSYLTMEAWFSLVKEDVVNGDTVLQSFYKHQEVGPLRMAYQATVTNGIAMGDILLRNALSNPQTIYVAMDPLTVDNHGLSEFDSLDIVPGSPNFVGAVEGAIVNTLDALGYDLGTNYNFSVLLAGNQLTVYFDCKDDPGPAWIGLDKDDVQPDGPTVKVLDSVVTEFTYLADSLACIELGLTYTSKVLASSITEFDELQASLDVTVGPAAAPIAMMADCDFCIATVATAPAGTQYIWEIKGDTVSMDDTLFVHNLGDTLDVTLTYPDSCVYRATYPEPAAALQEPPSELQQVSAPDVVRVYPNPVKGELTVEYHASMPEEAHIRIYSYRGQRLYRARMDLQVGSNFHQIDTGRWPAGMYVVDISSATKQLRKRIIVVN